jgi:hypothetical protein
VREESTPAMMTGFELSTDIYLSPLPARKSRGPLGPPI